ncbi:RNA polymerase II C-terminal domain phosphoserine binding [Teratosphaeria destructans]|uniref:RNA polymerase II C-terminal domain phosphoserine binding n=1 Tax=Teratosphaeria destructans TaxID=418781 RepID=A0A9W7SKF0_9PEZI|nr:RNA polymerase II C-terminal domain phosphoserine binding [Teratosphaeria destructans]
MSDNELDAELLGMVGGESDDEGDSEVQDVHHTQVIQDADDEPPKESVEKVEEPSKRLKGVAQKVKGRRKKKARRESIDEEILDLGDGSSSPARSIRADAESDNDAPGSPEIDEEAPLYPLEGVYLNERDREEILGLPEIRREEILAERREEETKKQQDLQLKRVLAASDNRNKRKAANDLDDGGRRTRPKAEKAKTALDDYRRAREQKGTQRDRVATGGGRRDERPPSPAGSDRDADGESEVEWAEPSSEGRYGRDEPPADLKDFERCRIGRSGFAKVCFYPGFEAAIQGCFARVSIGVDKATGQNLYRMAQIKGFKEGKPYSMEGSNGKTFMTDQYAVVAHGKSERPWPFSACSDSKFTDQEFDRLIDTLKKESVRAPSKKYLAARNEAINGLLYIKWDDGLLSQKFSNMKRMERKLDPANIAQRKRDDVEKRKLEAQESGDADEVMRCDAELAALQNNSSTAVNGHANGTRALPINNRPAPPVLSQQERMAQLNAKNRSKTVQEVRKAQLEEKRKLALAREKAAKEAKAKAEAEAQKKLLAVPKDDMADLFGSEDGTSGAGTPVGGKSPRRSRTGTPMNGAAKKEKKVVGAPGGPIGALKKKKLDDEVIGDMDLGIDVEI